MQALLSKIKLTPLELTKEELSHIISSINDKELSELMEYALSIRNQYFGKRIYLRALIEISSYCAQNCFYCGIRASNQQAERYRLTKDSILQCCEVAYTMGYRTFVLQSGEDLSYGIDDICSIISSIKEKFSDVALTISIGEKSYEEYLAYYQAGADRYLLRHEAASRRLYEHIHPIAMSYDNRRRCLTDLKKIGFQTGAGYMVGLPTQTSDDLAEDILFIRELQPHMVGIGPFLTHQQTPFKDEQSGTLRQTLLMLALTRITLPSVLLPATTSLGTLSDTGRHQGFLASANVIMPNVSPQDVRKKYLLYDGKVGTDTEIAEFQNSIEDSIQSWGFEIDMQRGDHPSRDTLSFAENIEIL